MSKILTVAELANLNIVPLISEGDFKDFYVDISRDAIKRLITQLELNTFSNMKCLFAGQVGCGKSTELGDIAQSLNTSYYIMRYSLRNVANPLFASFTNVVISLVECAVDWAVSHGIKINKKLVKDIKSYLSQQETITSSSERVADVEVGVKVERGFLSFMPLNLINSFRAGGSIRKETVTTISHSDVNFIKLVNNFFDDFSTHCGDIPLLLIIDDLDKLGLQGAVDIFINHYYDLQALNVNVIFTVPIPLCYSSQFCCTQLFDYKVIMNMIKVRDRNGSNCECGISFLKQIILKRIDNNLLASGVLDYIVLKSGGSIRLAFWLLKESANYALSNKQVSNCFNNKNQITLHDTELAYDNLKHFFNISVLSYRENITILQEIHRTGEINLDNNRDAIMGFLWNLTIFGYDDGEWYALNPAVEDCLRNRSFI